MQFADGKQQWVASDEFTREMHSNPGRVHTLAFAPDGGYFILYEDGSFAWYNLPETLHNKLNGRQKSLPGVDQLTIGPKGEWFVRFENGDWACNGHTDGCDNKINQLHREHCDIQHIAFGHRSTWLITYS